MDLIDDKWLKNFKDMFYNKKVVIILGAGVSTSSGIPDFRSTSGIFSHIQEKYKVKGERLFEYKFSLNPDTRNIYLDFIIQLKELVDKAQPSFTHHFLNHYFEKSRKCRIYTQNVDLLEEKAGIKYSIDNTTQLVYLHGDLNTLKCLYCGYKAPFTNKEKEMLKSDEVECKKCLERNRKRKEDNKRLQPQGIMHPNIVHYNQPHPDGMFIGQLNNLDSRCDLLLVVGTSLKIYGLKTMTKYFINRCKENGGKTFYINLTEPNKEFKNLFDFMYKGKCDDFFKQIAEKDIMEQIFNKEKEVLEDEIEMQDIEIKEDLIENKEEEIVILDQECEILDSSMAEIKSVLEEIDNEKMEGKENTIIYEVKEEEIIKKQPRKKYISRKIKAKRKK